MKSEIFYRSHNILRTPGGKFKKNQITTSFDAKFNADFEFDVKNLCLPTHLRENCVF